MSLAVAECIIYFVS